MADEVLIASFQADISDLQKKLDAYVASLEKVEQAEKVNQKELDKLIAKLKLSMVETGKFATITTKEVKATGLSFDQLNKKIKETFSQSLPQATKEVTKLKNEAKKTATEVGNSFSGVTSSIKGSLAGLAAGIGIAFSADAIIQFSKASVNAFLEAQETAERLRFTITQVGGESEAAFNRLIDQSAKLQKLTIYSDDSIQKAQDILATFGLTAQQIEDLIPKLADFASATKTDIVQAADQVGQGLQGAGREFKKYGIEVSATSTAMENLSAITEGYTRFQGAAAKETESLSGQLKQQANRADELQEALGSRLAPIFVKIRTAIFEATLGLLGFNKALEEVADEKIEAIEKNILSSADKIKAAGKDVVTEFSARIGELKATNEKAGQDIEALNKQITERIVALSKSARDLTPENDAIVKSLQEQVKATENIIAVTSDKIKAFEKVIDQENELRISSERTLTAEGLRTKSLIRLNELLEQNSKFNDLISQSNVDLVKKEIEARKKLADQAERDKDKRIAGTEAEITKLKSLGAEYSAIFELLSNQDKKQLLELSTVANVESDEDIRDKIKTLEALFKENEITIPVKVEAEDLPDLEKQFEILKTDLEAKGIAIPVDVSQIESLEDKVIALKKLFTDKGLSLPIEADPDNSIEGLSRRFNQLKSELQDKGISIPVSIDEVNLDAFRAKVAELAVQVSKDVTVPITLEPRADTEKFDDGIQEATDNLVNMFFVANEKVITAYENLFSELTALYQQFEQDRIRQIEKETEQQLLAFDQRADANEDSLDKRRISENEFFRLEQKNQQDKIKAEEAATKKINTIKKRQFNIDKAAAAIEIAIDTARATAAALADVPYPANIPAAAGIAALGVVQEVAVLSKANPYKKGTKASKEGLAVVGEEGPEFMMLPEKAKVVPKRQTKKYEKVVDAMIDDNFEQFVFKNYVTPQLQKQRENHTQSSRDKFVGTLTKAMIINNIASGKGDFYLERMSKAGITVNNLSEVGRAFAEAIKQDPYRA